MAKKTARTTRNKAERALLLGVGENIAAVRKKKGLSVYDVTGEDLPVTSRQHWQRIEGGKKSITLVTLFKVAKTLGVSADSLIEDLRL